MDDINDRNIASKLLDYAQLLNQNDLGLGRATADNFSDMLAHAAIRIRVLETENIMLGWKIEKLKSR